MQRPLANHLHPTFCDAAAALNIERSLLVEGRVIRSARLLGPHMMFRITPAYHRRMMLIIEPRFAAQAVPPIATRFSVAWSVCRLSHSFTVLKPFDVVCRVRTGQGKLEKVREFEWSGEN